MPQPTRLYLIRHGQSDGNAEGRFGGHGPTPLSKLGVEQATRTAKLLAKEEISAIYSSDLLRAVQTAEPLAKLLDLKINRSKALRERNVGVLEGLTFEQCKEKFPRDYYALLKREVNHVITDGESYRQLLRRVTVELRTIIRKHQNQRIAIFSHTGVLCFLTLHLLGAIQRHTKQTPWIITSNCGINRFEVRGRQNVRVLALNDTRHLIEPTGNDAFAVN